MVSSINGIYFEDISLLREIYLNLAILKKAHKLKFFPALIFKSRCTEETSTIKYHKQLNNPQKMTLLNR